MANCDKVSELYLGQVLDEQMQLVCRHRIHWLCGQAQGRTVLDVGCSQGIASVLLAREGFEVTGIDVEEASLDFARKLLAQEPESVRSAVTFQRADATRMPFGDGAFDTALLGEVLEHVVHPDKILAEVARVVKSGGRVALTTPLGLHVYHDHKRPFYPTDFLDLIERHFTVESLELVDKTIFCVATNRQATELFWQRSARFRDLVASLEAEILRFEERVHVQRNEWKQRNQKLAEAHEKEREAHRLALAEQERIARECDERIESLQRDLLTERERCAGTAGELRDKADVLRRLEALAASLQESLGAEKAQTSAALDRLARSNVELHAMSDRLADARARAGTLETENARGAELRGELRTLRLSAGRLQAALNKARDALAAARERAGSASERVRGLESELARQQASSEAARAGLARAGETALAEARQSFASQVAAVQAATQSALDALRSSCDQRVAALAEERERERAAAAAERAALQGAQAAGAQRIATLEAEVTRARETAAAERAVYQAAQAASVQSIAALEAELQHLQESAAAERGAVQTASDRRVTALADELQRAREIAARELDACRSDADQRITALEAEASRARQTAATEAQAALQAAQAADAQRLAALEAELQQARAAAAGELSSLRSAMQAACDRRLADLQAELQREREAAAAEKGALQKAVAAASDELRKARAATAQQQQVAAAQTEQLKQLREAVVAHIESEIASLREVERQQSVCRQQADTLREAEQKLTRVDSELENVTARLDALRRSKLGALTLKYWAWRAARRRRPARSLHT